MVGDNITKRLDKQLEIMRTNKFGSLDYRRAEDVFTGLLDTTSSYILSNELKEEYERKYYAIV